MKTKETIIQCYVKNICSCCKNSSWNDCEIRRRIDGTIKCSNYIKDEKKIIPIPKIETYQFSWSKKKEW